MNDLEKELINLWIGKKLKKFVSLFNTLLVSTEILCIIICRNDPWIQFTSIHWTFCFSLEVSINNFAFLLLSCYLYIAWTDFFFFHSNLYFLCCFIACWIINELSQWDQYVLSFEKDFEDFLLLKICLHFLRKYI